MPLSLPTGLSRNTQSASDARPAFRSGFDPQALASRRRSLWVWWHLLSLDAPTVAIIWCWFFGVVFQLKFPWATLPTLALGTWCVYVADRLLDGWRSTDMATLRDRHWFYLRHRKLFVAAWAFAAVPLAYLIFFHVDRQVRTDDIVLCLIGVVYFLLIHGSRSNPAHSRLFPAWFPKELVVGFLFAIATAVPAWARLHFPIASLMPHRIILLAATFAFGAICWLNCVAIQVWEDAEADQEVVHTILSGTRPENSAPLSPHGLTHYLGRHLIVFTGVVGILGLALTIVFAGTQFDSLFGSVAISAGLFIGLVRHSHRFSALSLRIAADAALLTPLLFAVIVC
ncbi:MAG TPA: hypothetical protein VN670_03995 [Acidobacteriaceae bacterium]|nr:hypothetical protein [Acidobacteriaceae bacterium]